MIRVFGKSRSPEPVEGRSALTALRQAQGWGILAVALMLGSCQQADSFAFQNTSITLPDDTAMLPDGPGVEAVTTNCLSCHSPEMILTQPRLTRKVWEAEVEKMAKVYKAPIDAKAVPQIVDYLVATNERLTPLAKTAP